jgi:threonine dehydrogenase-like Zn-dependent dehydrogenase
VRVPNAEGTLYNLSDPAAWPLEVSVEQRHELLKSIAPTSLLILGDILPTGVFAALQALTHPKVAPFLDGLAYPSSLLSRMGATRNLGGSLQDEDRLITFAVIGLGPVGICSSVALLDMLVAKARPFRIVAIDPTASRREKMEQVYAKIPAGETGRGEGLFEVHSIESAKERIKEWTSDVGCTAALEVSMRCQKRQ